jgi:hypothetical protein
MERNVYKALREAEEAPPGLPDGFHTKNPYFAIFWKALE